MFHSRTSNNKIDRIYETEFKTVYLDYKSSFCELFDKNGSFRIHQKNSKV